MASGKTDTWFPMYPADYLKNTLDLTLEEDAFYSRALNQVYINNGRIPSEPERLQRLLRVNRVQFNRCKWIFGRYFYEVGNEYGHRRADKEIQKAQERAEVARQNGRSGGRPPKQNPAETQRVNSGLPDGIAPANPDHNPEKSSSYSPSQSSPIGEDPPLPPKGRKRQAKTLIPGDWAPSQETVDWCAQHRLPDPDFQRLPFVTYWQGRGEARADWQATFRNWMTSPYRKDRPNGHQQNESAAQRNGRRFTEELGKIAAGIGAPGGHEVLLELPEADAGA